MPPPPNCVIFAHLMCFSISWAIIIHLWRRLRHRRQVSLNTSPLLFPAHRARIRAMFPATDAVDIPGRRSPGRSNVFWGKAAAADGRTPRDIGKILTEGLTPGALSQGRKGRLAQLPKALQQDRRIPNSRSNGAGMDVAGAINDVGYRQARHLPFGRHPGTWIE